MSEPSARLAYVVGMSVLRAISLGMGVYSVHDDWCISQGCITLVKLSSKTLYVNTF